MGQKSLTQENVRQWVKEQNALGHKTKYIPAQTTLRDKDESLKKHKEVNKDLLEKKKEHLESKPIQGN